MVVSGKLLRCSVHSIRPVSPTEKLHHELHGGENPASWKTLDDVIPRREYFDITDEVPGEDDVEQPLLPEHPDGSTLIPLRRAHSKKTFAPEDFRVIHRNAPIGQSSSISSSSRPFGLGDAHLPPMAEDDDVNDYAPTTPEVDLGDPPEPVSKALKLTDAAEPASKMSRKKYDLKWTEELEAAALEEQDSFSVFDAMMECEDCFKIELEVDLASQKQRKTFERNPILYLVKKMANAEVSLHKLTSKERELFTRAKAKEVDSFLKNAAVRKCLDDAEIKEAYDSQRIVKARWVLTWKATPPDELDEARKDAQDNASKTLYTNNGDRKAKARIVLLGFQHPNLLDRSFKTAAPVQSMLGRNLVYLLSGQHQWPLKGLDLATAFLQTMPMEADAQLWTTGVEELRSALGVGKEGIMKILRNIYGSTTAPRGLWLDLHKALINLGATAILGERCLWAWFSTTELDSTGRFPKLLGVMGVMLMTFTVVVTHFPRNGKRSMARFYRPIVGELSSRTSIDMPVLMSALWRRRMAPFQFV